MNPDARKFFEHNPNEPYWYYSATLRVPNPKIKPWLNVPRIPWDRSHDYRHERGSDEDHD